MNKTKNYLITGIISIIPIYLTYWIIENLFKFFSGPGKSIIDTFFNVEYQFLTQFVGFILTLTFLIVLGLIVKNVFGKKIYNYFELLLDSIPIINRIYKTIKNVTDTLASSKEQTFTKVVMIQYPRKDLWTFAMVTGESVDSKGHDYYNLFVPTTPNPTSGYLIICKKEDTIDAGVSVEEGLSIIISGGMIGPKKLKI
tara:strand:- start:3349 stop:3942 length:594 start_codon:yes stop_codon:yes gene_type:complete